MEFDYSCPEGQGKLHANLTARRSSGCYTDLKIRGTIFSAAWICFNDFGFLSWVP
jgi:hypothetical protein